MSEQKTESSKGIPVYSIENDAVTIGGKKFQINRKPLWKKRRALTRELEMLMRAPQNMGGTKDILDMAERSDKWIEEVFNTFLIDFDESCLDSDLADGNSIDLIAAQIFLAIRTNHSFLAIASQNISSSANQTSA